MDKEPETKPVDAQQNTEDKKIQDQPSAAENVSGTEKAASEPQESEKERNFREFREGRKLDRKQREDAERRANEKEAEAAALKAAMETLLNKPSVPIPTVQYVPHEYGEETEEQRIKRQVDVLLAERDRRTEDERRLNEMKSFPQRLVNDFRDFNQVCTEENLDYLEYHFPEVAAPFKKLAEGYDKWADIYKAVKRFVPSDGRKDEKKAEKNFTKPQSMAVPGLTPTGDSAPMMMDDKRRADNWARMQKVMKGVK